MNYFKGMFDRIVKWRCGRGDHRFFYYKLESPKFIFYCRQCSFCGRKEVQSAGPMGDGKWKSFDDFPRHKFERDELLKATRKD